MTFWKRPNYNDGKNRSHYLPVKTQAKWLLINEIKFVSILKHSVTSHLFSSEFIIPQKCIFSRNFQYFCLSKRSYQYLSWRSWQCLLAFKPFHRMVFILVICYTLESALQLDSLWFALQEKMCTNQAVVCYFTIKPHKNLNAHVGVASASLLMHRAATGS